MGIVDPEKKSKSIAWLNLENKAVATSGSYERFAEINGKKYAHIIHPKTGYPVSGLQSVTIISADAELCDAVATSIFLLGREKGLEFVNRFDDLQCFIVDENDNYYYSDNLKQRAYEIKN
ncbi:Thiamine biosynthesis lipoprotein ApbE precursor [compost metagenome]